MAVRKQLTTNKKMITYKDKTFCADEVEKHTCGRELTEEDKKHAEVIGLPIAFGSFCKQITKNNKHK